MNTRSFLRMFTVIALSLSFVLASCTVGSTDTENSSKIEVSTIIDQDLSREMIGNMYISGYPVVYDKEVIKVLAIQNINQPNWNEYQILNDMERKTNVAVEWELVPVTGALEKLKLIFATNDLPDALMPKDLLKTDDFTYGRQGLLMPLNELIEEWAPNIQNMYAEYPNIKNVTTTPDGNIYSLPTYNPVDGEVTKSGQALVLNKKWLDKLNLKEPETTDEFYEVLKAFRDNDPNGNNNKDEIPFSTRPPELMFMFGPFGTVDNARHLHVTNDDKVLFAPAMLEYKEAIKYFNMLFTEELLDNELFIQDQKQLNAKGMSDEIILGGYLAHHRSAVVGNKRALEDYINILPLKGPNGHQIWNNNNPEPNAGLFPATFVISSKTEKADIIMRWIDLAYDKEFGFKLARAPEFTMETQSDGKLKKKTPPDGMGEGEFFSKYTPMTNFPWIFYPEIAEKVIENQNVLIKREQHQRYKPYIAKRGFPTIFYASDDVIKRLNSLSNDINGYVEQMKAKWICDGGVENEWDVFQQKMKNMGLDEMMEIYSDIYNAYKTK